MKFQLIRLFLVALYYTVLYSLASAQSITPFVSTAKVNSDRFADIINELGQQGIIVQDGPILPPKTSPQENCGVSGPPVTEKSVQQTPISEARQRIPEQLAPYIVGGTPATIEDFPWQVILIDGAAPPEVRSGLCGGSLIGYKWVLTAAHCLAGISDPSQVDIVSGSTWPKWADQGDRVKIVKLHVHKQYNHDTLENDIALLELVRPAKKGRSIRLPQKDLVIPIGSSATVTGWGAVTSWGPMADRLLKANLPIVSNVTCNAPESYNGLVKEGMLCAGERAGGLDACQGDSGGPLVAKVNGVNTIIGIVSGGASTGCARRFKYGVYTRVSAYRDWIRETMGSGRIASR